MSWAALGGEAPMFLNRGSHRGLIHGVHPVVGTVQVEVPLALGTLEQDQGRDVMGVGHGGSHNETCEGK
jgi:hypothetical protein